MARARAGAGFSLIDLMLAVGITALLFGGIFMVFFSVIDTTVNYELRRAASAIINQRIELVRALAFEQVGVTGGVPTGVLPAYEAVTWDGTLFAVSTMVRNIDDPFDGTVTSTPTDTAPADYKLVEVAVSCAACPHFTPVRMTTTVAPAGLESSSRNGSLFITVIDANGAPVPGATVHVVNVSTTPAIDFTDTTNASGELQLVDVPTSTQRYAIEVSKPGFSSERTYAVGGAGNPNPAKPHATVAEHTVTELSFAVDALVPVTLATVTTRCVALPGKPLELTGSKVLGTSPDVPKFTLATSTGPSGSLPLTLEWDTYALAYGGSGEVVGSTLPLPLVLTPGVTTTVNLALTTSTSAGLRVVTRSVATGQPVAAAIAVAGSAAGITGEDDVRQTSWSAGTVTSASGVSLGDTLELLPEGGPFSTSTQGTLESGTIDLGPGGSARSLSWLPLEQPAGAGSGAVRFQVAASDHDGDWSYAGPDGSGASYFTSGGPVPETASGKRYVRYRALLGTGAPSVTPRVEEVAVAFSGPCVPPGVRVIAPLAAGSYAVTASAAGFQAASSTVAVSSGLATVTLDLLPQ